MTHTNEEQIVFAADLKSVTNAAKFTSSIPKRNITAIKLFAETVKKSLMLITVVLFNLLWTKTKQCGDPVQSQRMQMKKS